ncbi:MAG: glycosyltransferase [Nanoarchaeota archaeon]|nr:glycosyltransferase [Nanoarchaeota archaeon]
MINILKKEKIYKERIYKAITDSAYNINDFDKAIHYGKKLVELLEKKEDPEKLAEGIYFLAILYSKVERYSDSVEHLKRSLEIYEEHGLLDKMAKGYSTLGIVREKSSNYPEALKAFTRSLKLQQEIGERTGEGGELRRLGRIFYKRLNQYKTAEEYFRKALNIFEKEGQKQEEIQALLEIGLVRERVGDFNESLKYYDRAYSLAKDINYSDGITPALLYKANSYWFQADYQNAFNSVRKALKIAEKHQNKMNLIYTILVYVVWFLSTYFIIVFLLILFKNKNKLYDSPSLNDDDELPKTSIIISAYNEEEKIADCIQSLKAIDYPKDLYEVIILNDGSEDKTKDIAAKYADGRNIIFVDNKENKGKAACLNQGISLAKGSYVACMDADTIVPEDILKKTIPYFKDKEIGSVTVSVEVNHPKNFLQRIIRLEYILGLSLFLKVFSSLKIQLSI